MHSSDINTTINNGYKFLSNFFKEHGCWSTFDSSRGQSDVWVTGYVAGEIASLLKGTTLGTEVCDWLLSNRGDDGGWGYKREFPSDADSTATVYLAVSQLDPEAADGVADESCRFLAKHYDEETMGFRTYQSLYLMKILGADSREEFSGWDLPRLDVTLNVLRALVLQRSPVGRSVLDSASSAMSLNNGVYSHSEAYWWTNSIVCAVLIDRLNVLSELPSMSGEKFYSHLISEDPTESTNYGISSDYGTNGCVFATSLFIQTVLKNSVNEPLSLLGHVAFLLDQQMTDGGWKSGPILAIPTPLDNERLSVKHWRVDVPGFPNILSDKSRVLLTAVAIQALIQYQQRI